MKSRTRKQAETRGRRAEFWAQLLLRFKGYQILKTRFKTRSGEIDIIAHIGNTLVAVEVKRRKNLQLAHDALTAHTLMRIENTVAIFQQTNAKYHDHDVRFDAIFILPNFRIHHLKDAWRAY